MKGVVILFLIIPAVLSHVIGGYRRRVGDYDEENNKNRVVMYNTPAKHFRENQLSNGHRWGECKRSGECSCILLPIKRITEPDEDTGLIKKFVEVMCVGDRGVLNTTTPFGQYYRCNPKNRTHRIPDDPTYENKPNCECEYEDISELKCPNEY